MKASIEDVNPYSLVDAPVVVNKYGDICFFYVWKGVDILTSDKESLLDINEVIETAYSFLGEGYVIHQQEVVISSRYKYPQNEGSFIRKSFFEHYQGKEYHKQVTYLYIIKINSKNGNRNYSTPRLGKSDKFSSAARDIEAIKSAVEGFVRHGQTCGIHLLPLTDNNQIYKLLQGYLGGFEEGIFQDITFQSDRIVIGNEKLMGIMSIDSDDCLPPQLLPYRINEDFSNERVKLHSDTLYGVGSGLKANHVVNRIYFLLNQNGIKNELELKNKRLNSLSGLSKMNKRFHQDSDKFLENTYSGSGKLIVRAHVNIIYWANSKEEFNKIEIDIKSGFRKIGITPHQSNYLNQKAIFLSSMPGNGATLPLEGETFYTHAHIATALLNKECVTNSKSNFNPHALITTDRITGLPIERDSWFEPYKTKTITARNSCTAGKTGGGKTVSVINKLFQYWEMGFYINCIDIGRSLEVICKLVKGNYVIYKEGMSLGINPYGLTDKILTANRLEYLANFTSMLWRPQFEMDETQRAALEEVILTWYKAHKKESESYYRCAEGSEDYGFKHFYLWVSENVDLVNKITKEDKTFFDVNSFLLATKQFYNGKYSNLFTKAEGELLFDPENRFTVWEMDNVVDHPTLFPIFAMLITHLTTEVMWNKKGINKFFWIEEAWKVALKPGMANYFIYQLKTMRKFDGGFGFSIQEIGDMNVPNSRLMEVVKANVDVWDFTYHPDALAEGLARELGWIREDKPFDHRLDLLKSIKNDVNSKYPYMERLSIIGNDVKVVREMLSPEQIAAFMSDMNDKEKLFPFIEKNGGDYEKGIVDYVNSLN